MTFAHITVFDLEITAEGSRLFHLSFFS